MSLTTSQLQQIRSALAVEIRIMERSRNDARITVREVKIGIKAGTYDTPASKEFITGHMAELHKKGEAFHRKALRLGELQKVVKHELNMSLHHTREVTDHSGDVVAVISQTPVLGLFTNEALVTNVIALTELQSAA